MGNYDDIICLPHHRSKKRIHMSMQDRAAQFSPFAALTGFDSALEETGRLTDNRPELMDYGNMQLDRALARLLELLPQQPSVSLTCFVPDTRKSGGHFETISGRVQKIDLYHQILVLTDGRSLSLEHITRIDSPLLDDLADL